MLVDVSATTSKALQLRIKRMIDVLGAAVLLVLTSPLLVLTAVAIRLTSPGPAIFRQERIGLDGCRFVMWKFRSMLVDQRALIDLDDVYDVGNARLIKREDDPRITPIGRVIRRTSIDELPQLVSVMRGDMSLVGPRPLLPFMLEPYPQLMEARCRMRPGVTGLWQVSDRAANETAVGALEERAELPQFALPADERARRNR